MCKGRGVVTLRATLVHIDDEGHITEKPNVFTTSSKSTINAHLRTAILYLHPQVRKENLAESAQVKIAFNL